MLDRYEDGFHGEGSISNICSIKSKGIQAQLRSSKDFFPLWKIPYSTCHLWLLFLVPLPRAVHFPFVLRGSVMRGIFLRSTCICAALVLFLVPATGAALAAGKPFVAPVNAEVTRKFEAPSHKFGPGHRGIDYGVPSGTTVRASGVGTVTFAGQVADDGLFVTIEHQGGISTTYSYLSQIDVSKGDRVNQGQAIALSGEGHGGSQAALHFGAKQGGDYIDPEVLLKELDDISDLISLEAIKAGRLDSGADDFREALFVPQGGVQPVPRLEASHLGNEGGGLSKNAHRPQAAGNSEPANDESVRPPEYEAPARVDQSSLPEWWRTLPQKFRELEIAKDPARWARQPFVSAADRDIANRALLTLKIIELEEYRRSAAGQAELKKQKWLNVAKGFISPLSIRSFYDREAEIDRKLRSARALWNQLQKISDSPSNRLTPGDVYLLDFDIDFAGGDGKAVVALGDPATAEHVGVFVPGINNALGSVRGPLRDAATLRAQAFETSGQSVGQRTSTIMWIGYDNPNGLTDAPNRGEAREGALSLNQFINQLRENHLPSRKPQHLTVFGHSYGSTVAGLAGLGGMKVDDLVFLGSPGVGEFNVTAKDFPQERVWAARSWLDSIGLVIGSLGMDPAAEIFGAKNVPVSRWLGHSDYIELGSLATHNFAKILTGRHQEVR
jgi:murein DD-endopeptidase MepM/ murein hydrolase activator NlpD